MFPSWRIAILLFSAGCLVLLLAPDPLSSQKGDGPTRDMGSGPLTALRRFNIDNLPLI